MGDILKVFISSTSRDLPEHRKTLDDIITELKMFPIGMEHFQPTVHNAMQVCYDAVHEADIFLGLYAFRYGFVPPETMSYKKKDGGIASSDAQTGVTEWEYKWAIERGIPIVILVVANDAPWIQSDIEKGVGAERLIAFKDKISGIHVIRFFKDLIAFNREASIALSNAKREIEIAELNAKAMRPQSPAEIAKAEDSALTVANSQFLKSQQEAKKQTKEVGMPPKRYDDNSFHDRDSQQTDIKNFLHNRRGGVVSVYGQGGIGKTGLVCKVLGDLEKINTVLDGRIFMRAENASSISIDHIVGNFAKILPDAKLPTGQDSIQLTPRQKTEALLEALAGGRYLLIIDNAETLQDENNHLVDKSLESFLETVLENDGNGALTVILTSRQPIPFKPNLKAKERRIFLDDGLPLEDAREFLRQLDFQKRLPEDDSKLDTLHERLRGFPRALEAAVGWLDNNVNQNLDNLMAAFPSDPDLTPHLVEKAQDSLPEAFQKVIQALALASLGVQGQGIPQATLEYLLAPFMDSQQLPDLLNLLVQSRFILYNESTRSYSLHPLDRAHALQAIPEGSEADAPKNPLAEAFRLLGMTPPSDPSLMPVWTRYSLNVRMADFYSQQRVSEPKSLADLEPQLREFEHRFANADYDTACQVLAQIDFKFLLLWGYVELMLELHSRLEDRISNPALEQSSIGNLGSAYYRIGQAEKATNYYEKSLAMAVAQNNRQNEGALLANLGSVYGDLGQVEKAIDYYEQALVIHREIKDRHGQNNTLINLGNAYYQLGQVEKAIDYYEQGLVIHREIKDRHGEGNTLVNLGNAYSQLGQVEKAIDYYEQALVIHREIKDRHGEGADLGNLALTEIVLQRYTSAIQHALEALKIAEETKNPVGVSYRSCSLALAYLYSGETSQALTTIGAARQYNVPQNNHATAALHGIIALTAKEDAEAKTAFDDALRFADELLTMTQNFYDALYSRAIAHLGVLACGGDASHLEQAKADIAHAKAIFAGQGVIDEKKRLVEALCRAANQSWDIGL